MTKMLHTWKTLSVIKLQFERKENTEKKKEKTLVICKTKQKKNRKRILKFIRDAHKGT